MSEEQFPCGLCRSCMAVLENRTSNDEPCSKCGHQDVTPLAGSAAALLLMAHREGCSTGEVWCERCKGPNPFSRLAWVDVPKPGRVAELEAKNREMRTLLARIQDSFVAQDNHQMRILDQDIPWVLGQHPAQRK